MPSKRSTRLSAPLQVRGEKHLVSDPTERMAERSQFRAQFYVVVDLAVGRHCRVVTMHGLGAINAEIQNCESPVPRFTPLWLVSPHCRGHDLPPPTAFDPLQPHATHHSP